MKLQYFLPALFFFVVGLSNTANATTLYDQHLLEGPQFMAISDTIDGSTGRRAYDSFIIASTANLLTVTWWGCIIDAFTPYDNPATYDIQNWEISIWANNNGLPEQLLFSEFRTDAEVGREQLGTFDDPVVGTVPYFRFDLTLTTSLLLQADTTYWLSVLAFSPTGNPWFNWMASVPGVGNDQSVSENLGMGQFNNIPEDRAFVLGGNVVPLPAAVWLLASALGVLGLRHRREPQK